MKKYETEVFHPCTNNTMSYSYYWSIRPLMTTNCFGKKKIKYQIVEWEKFMAWTINQTSALFKSFDEAKKCLPIWQRDKRREYKGL